MGSGFVVERLWGTMYVHTRVGLVFPSPVPLGLWTGVRRPDSSYRVPSYLPLRLQDLSDSSGSMDSGPGPTVCGVGSGTDPRSSEVR